MHVGCSVIGRDIGPDSSLFLKECEAKATGKYRKNEYPTKVQTMFISRCRGGGDPLIELIHLIGKMRVTWLTRVSLRYRPGTCEQGECHRKQMICAFGYHGFNGYKRHLASAMP
jgi:hypothetical protein